MPMAGTALVLGVRGSRGLRCVSTSAQRCANTQAESPLRRLLQDSASYGERSVDDPQQEWATLPYPRLPRASASEPPALRDPRLAAVLLFPGQGAQRVGMGRDLLKFPAARDLYELASKILGFDMLKLCLDGPMEELNKHCQLAVMVTSLATLERLKEERPSAVEQCAATAGFSLGEITALVFAGSLEFEQALRLVQIRATAMEAASRDHPSGMITVMYGPDSKVNFAILKAKQHCQQLDIQNAHCQVANYLYPHCKVIAGSEPAIQYIEKHGKEFGIRRVQRVKVSGGFHTEVMRSAVEPFKQALAMCDVQTPNVPVISNVDAKAYRDAKHIRQQLPKQIVKPVRWEQCLHGMFTRATDEHFPQTFTIGPGNNIRTILRQVNAKAWDSSVQVDA